MSYEQWPHSLQKRERALGTLVRGIADEYKAQLGNPENTCGYEVHLERKVGALDMIADELGGITPLPLPGDLDNEIPF